MTMKTLLIGTAAIAGQAVTLPALAEGEDWDKDGDGGYSEAEFSGAFGASTLFGEWDEDGDGTINEAEFVRGNFNRYDRNGDGTIDEIEREEVDRDMGREVD